VPVEATKQAYSREEVRRLLDVSERQLRSWEQQKFLLPTETFDFSGLLALRTLVGLRANKIPTAQIRTALAALRERLVHIRDPLTELRIYSQGKKIRVQFDGQKMEPVTGQLLLNFDEVEIKKLFSFPTAAAEEAKAAALHKKRKEAERWFEKGLNLEHEGAPLDDVIDAYKKASEIDPSSAGALVNLGTVYFNLRSWRDAERHYRKALEVDPEYALAHYNLGNLFDEKGDRLKALNHYQAALRLHPNYADAHYNIALVYQSLNQPWRAVQHWKKYLKLDPGSTWAEIARRELEKLRQSTIVRGAGPDPNLPSKFETKG
jgi:tetratricopeptide (TPR) repeat protein